MKSFQEFLQEHDTEDRQKAVVDRRVKNGYELLGYAQSLNGGEVAVISKGKHTMAINSMGYDEHTPGKTYKIQG